MMRMIDEVDVLKARKLTTMMFADLFENKKKLAAEEEEAKNDRRRKKRRKFLDIFPSFFL